MLILSAGVIRSQLRERFAARCDISFTSSTNQVVAFARFFSCAMCYAMYKCVFPFFVYKYWNDLEWIFRLFNPCIHVYMCHIYRIMILYIFSYHLVCITINHHISAFHLLATYFQGFFAMLGIAGWPNVKSLYARYVNEGSCHLARALRHDKLQTWVGHDGWVIQDPCAGSLLVVHMLSCTAWFGIWKGWEDEDA